MRQYLGVIMQQNGGGIHYSLAGIPVLQHSHTEFHIGNRRFSMRYEEQKNDRVRKEKKREVEREAGEERDIERKRESGMADMAIN